VTVAPAPPPVAEREAVAGEPADEPPSPALSAPGSCALDARLRAEGASPDGSEFVLVLTNTGSTPLHLVTPGDGSESGWRTPVLTWTATADGKPASTAPLARCGLMNRIKKDEIFTLAPGASREIREWLPRLSLPAGRYTVRLTYRNDPTIEIDNDTDEEVKRLLASTTSCQATTNAVEVTVP